MRQAFKLVYRFIRDLDIADQLFGLFGAWLAFVEPRDVLAFKLALEAPGDRVLDPPARIPAFHPSTTVYPPYPSWPLSESPGSAASGVAPGASATQAFSQRS